MLHSMQNLIGFTIGATDGEIGKVKDFYFDDNTFKVKYLIVETGSWLIGRKVLLSPFALHEPDWDAKLIPANLTKDQIKHSPDIDTEKPVSRQQEADLHNHYSWPYNEQAGVGFMTTGMMGGVVAPDVPFEDRIHDEVTRHENNTISDRGPASTGVNEPQISNQLRSFKDIEGTNVRASDDELGEVEDALVDCMNWNVPFLVIETGSWYEGKKVLVPTRDIGSSAWDGSSLRLNQSTDFFRNSPDFDYRQPISQDNEERLYSYHHR